MNQFTATGKLIADAESRTFGNGGKVTKIAVSIPVYKTKDATTGKWQDKTFIMTCNGFNKGEHGKLADRMEGLTKGQKVMVTGKLDMDEWKDKDGNKRTKVVLAIDEFEVIGQAEAQRQEERPKRKEPDPVTYYESTGDNVPF